MGANSLGDFFRYGANMTRGAPALGGASPLASLGGDVLKFKGDNTGATDVIDELEAFIEANPNKYVALDGVYKISRPIDPDASFPLIGSGRKVTTILYPKTTPAIYTTKQAAYQVANRIQSSVLGYGIGLAPDGLGTTDTDMVTYVQVANAAIYTQAQPVALTSGDAHPAEALLGASSKRRMGISGIYVLYCDTTTSPHRVYLSHQIPFTSLIVTNAYLTEFKTDRFFHVSNICFKADPADGDWDDLAIDAPSGLHNHAVIPYGYPYATVHDIEGLDLWEGLLLFDSCPFFNFYNVFGRHLPNLQTWSGSGMAGRLGYGVSITSLSGGGRGYNFEFHQSRHGITTDGHGISASSSLNDGSYFLRCGEPFDVDIFGGRVYNCWGVAFDTHEEGYNINFDSCTNYYPVRGSQGGSYRAYGVQFRCSKASLTNYKQYGGQYGIRIAGQSNRYIGAEYHFDQIHIEGLRSSDDLLKLTGTLTNDSVRNAAFLVSPQENTYIDDAARIPKIYIDNFTTVDCNQSIVCFGTNVSGGMVNIRLGKSKFIRGGVPIELFGNTNMIVHDSVLFDFDGTTRAPADFACVALWAKEAKASATVTGAEITFMEKPKVIKSASTKPATFFKEMDTVANKYYTLPDGAFIETNIGAVTATTLLASGSTTIFSR